MAADLRSMANQKEFSDVKLLAGGVEFLAHKAILHARSHRVKVFNEAILFYFFEENFPGRDLHLS
jgi:hypothetical protein